MFNQNGTLYGSGGTGLYTINTTTGGATLVGDTGLTGGFTSEGDLAFLNGVLYETVTNGSVSDLATINPATGAGVLVGQVDADATLYGLVTGSNGTLYGVDGTKIYAVNTTTGSGTLVQSYSTAALGAANGAAVQTEAVPSGNFLVQDNTAGNSYYSSGTPYSGPVAGLTSEFVVNTSDILNVTAKTPNVFIEVGYLPGQQTPPQECGINVSVANGNNVLDGYGGSDFLTGGTGNNTFYVDDRTLSQNSWSTRVNFPTGDNTTVSGVTSNDFTLDWIGDTYGAGGAYED